MNATFEPQPGYLLVTVSGEFVPGDAKQTVAGMVARCEALGLPAILIDGRGLTNLVSIGDRFDIAAVFAGLKSRIRVAVLVPEWQHVTKTLEHTAVNRGAMLRTTTSEAEAREFLGLG